ncbi:MAG: class I SAM-dependent methyltransferase [Asgard group archaeon]|nr:class I SAM-dependent methyltransferase [Asgard group archaeon]
MKDQEMYRNLAKYYDKIYHDKDYKKEVDDIKKIVSKYKKSKGNKLLDIGCGTGGHLQHLVKDFKCTGLDLNKDILKIALEKVPQISTVQSDMSDMELGEKFDVITCLFSSIGYILTKDKLKKTINNFSNHLQPGGIVIIEPWLTPDIYRAGSPHMTVYDGEDMKIARVNISDIKDENISYFEMHFLIAEPNKPVLHLIDKHELALFPHELLMDYMKESGLITEKLTVEFYADRGLLIGVKK